MFTDMKTSEDTMKGFHASLGPDITDYPALTVQVLTTGSWPSHSSAICNLPSEILGICEKFRMYYLGTHTGRRLSWQTNMGHADIKATFGKGQKHELNVSTYHMCILMLFNSADRLSYREIEQATEIPPTDLKRSLQSLACVKGKNVIRKEPMSKEVAEDDAFFFNDKFSSKLYKVKISTVVAQKESEPEKQETRQRVEEDRKPQIEAAIVRIMKSRRVLDHNNIVAEVTKQLQSRFLPNPVLIKKRIESLIEREFLERDKADRKLYRYLA
jgi:cullin 3